MTLSFLSTPSLLDKSTGKCAATKKIRTCRKKGWKGGVHDMSGFPKQKKHFFSYTKNVAGICFACPKKEIFLYIIACLKYEVPKPGNKLFFGLEVILSYPSTLFPPIELCSNVFLAMSPLEKNVSVFWIYDKVYTKNLKGGEGSQAAARCQPPPQIQRGKRICPFCLFFGKSISLFLCFSDHFEQSNGLLVKSIPLFLRCLGGEGRDSQSF